MKPKVWIGGIIGAILCGIVTKSILVGPIFGFIGGAFFVIHEIYDENLN